MPTACHSIFILSHLLQDRDIFWSSHCTSHCSAMYTFINEVWHGMWICIPTQAWWGSPCVLNTYHPLTLIQVSRVWSHLIASMTSTARQCWTTPDHLLESLVLRTPGRAMEQQPPVCRVIGHAACEMLSPLQPGLQTQCTPGCGTVGHRSCWPGRISHEWVPEQHPWAHTPACHWLPMRKQLAPSLTIRCSAGIKHSNAN